MALENAEKQKKAPVSDLFSDVFAELPWHLQQQKEQLSAHLAKYGDEYNLSEFVDEK